MPIESLLRTLYENVKKKIYPAACKKSQTAINVALLFFYVSPHSDVVLVGYLKFYYKYLENVEILKLLHVFTLSNV